MKKITRAYNKLVECYSAENLAAWKVNPDLGLDFGIGVMLNGTCAKEVIAEQIRRIVSIGNKIAEEYNLNAVVNAETIASGCAMVAYVGLKT
jgi:hypothetical protein